MRKIFRAEYMKSSCRKGAYTPGIKTADQPVLLDVPDSLDVEEGIGGVGQLPEADLIRQAPT